ncbi:elongation of fatty acids protein 3-like [Camellia sinensis]|uniref:elongation of fatty acids protein 3-like n=1 Tax=Camellia sinensis TaxID=4442 RepID=UPI0010367ECE|nr:elongation of fatty acids protein 3-like [Camellia sinensis]
MPIQFAKRRHQIGRSADGRESNAGDVETREFHSFLKKALTLTGLLFSSASEIWDARWFWASSKIPFQWLLCFPLGTGRVFFWSYLFCFLHTFCTFFSILRGRHHSFFRLFNHSILIFMSFLWLEFSQSFATSVYSLVYGYRFWTAIGLPDACFPFVVTCQIVLLGCNVLCHVGVLLLHFLKGGCNGIGAWSFNSVLNAAILLLFLNFYVKMHLRRRKVADFDAIKDGDVDPDMAKNKDI